MLSLNRSQNPKTGFLLTRSICESAVAGLLSYKAIIKTTMLSLNRSQTPKTGFLPTRSVCDSAVAVLLLYKAIIKTTIWRSMLMWSNLQCIITVKQLAITRLGPQVMAYITELPPVCRLCQSRKFLLAVSELWFSQLQQWTHRVALIPAHLKPLQCTGILRHIWWWLCISQNHDQWTLTV